jgi:hypothetical protein
MIVTFSWQARHAGRRKCTVQFDAADVHAVCDNSCRSSSCCLHNMHLQASFGATTAGFNRAIEIR